MSFEKHKWHLFRDEESMSFFGLWLLLLPPFFFYSTSLSSNLCCRGSDVVRRHGSTPLSTRKAGQKATRQGQHYSFLGVLGRTRTPMSCPCDVPYCLPATNQFAAPKGWAPEKVMAGLLCRSNRQVALRFFPPVPIGCSEMWWWSPLNSSLMKPARSQANPGQATRDRGRVAGTWRTIIRWKIIMSGSSNHLSLLGNTPCCCRNLYKIWRRNLKVETLKWLHHNIFFFKQQCRWKHIYFMERTT
jgi:hypothetical protein